MTVSYGNELVEVVGELRNPLKIRISDEYPTHIRGVGETRQAVAAPQTCGRSALVCVNDKNTEELALLAGKEIGSVDQQRVIGTRD
jgi:hypothetical protein